MENYSDTPFIDMAMQMPRQRPITEAQARILKEDMGSRFVCGNSYDESVLISLNTRGGCDASR